MAQKKPTAPGTTPGALTHSPFAKLADSARLAGLAKSHAPPEPHRPEPRKRFAPCKLRMRLESTGRSGKVVTRVSGLPVDNLEAIASRLRKALGCGASIEDGDVILQGSLKERAAEWLERAGDLEAIKEPDQRVSPQAATAAASVPSASAPSSSLSGAKRRDVRPGQRVAIVQKADQETGKLTDGIVRDLLTSSPTHPRGIKVRLESGEVGRVKKSESRPSTNGAGPQPESRVTFSGASIGRLLNESPTLILRKSSLEGLAQTLPPQTGPPSRHRAPSSGARPTLRAGPRRRFRQT